VPVEQVGGVDLEACERGACDLLDVLGPAGQAHLPAAGVEREPELGGDHDLPAERGERLADEFLVDDRAVHLGGIEDRDTASDRGADQGEQFAAGRGRGRSFAAPSLLGSAGRCSTRGGRDGLVSPPSVQGSAFISGFGARECVVVQCRSAGWPVSVC
jgi:hypothetical protein